MIVNELFWYKYSHELLIKTIGQGGTTGGYGLGSNPGSSSSGSSNSGSGSGNGGSDGGGGGSDGDGGGDGGGSDGSGSDGGSDGNGSTGNGHGTSHGSSSSPGTAASSSPGTAASGAEDAGGTAKDQQLAKAIAVTKAINEAKKALNEAGISVDSDAGRNAIAKAVGDAGGYSGTAQNNADKFGVDPEVVDAALNVMVDTKKAATQAGKSQDEAVQAGYQAFLAYIHSNANKGKGGNNAENSKTPTPQQNQDKAQQAVNNNQNKAQETVSEAQQAQETLDSIANNETNDEGLNAGDMNDEGNFADIGHEDNSPSAPSHIGTNTEGWAEATSSGKIIKYKYYVQYWYYPGNRISYILLDIRNDTIISLATEE